MNLLHKWWSAVSLQLLAGAPGLGVYLSREGLTLAHLEKGLSGVRVRHYLTLPGELGKLEDLSLPLQETISLWGLQSCPVSLAVSHGLGFCQGAVLPRVVAENLAQVVAYELDRFLPLPADLLYFDFQVLEEKDTEIHLMLMALPRGPVERCLTLLNQAGLRPVSVELEPQAAANAFILLAGKVPSPWLLAHLEPEGAVFSVINGRTIRALTQTRAQGRDPAALLQAHLASLDQAGQDLKAVCWYGQRGPADLVKAAVGPGELEVISHQKLSLEGLPPDAVPDAALPAVGAALRGLGKVSLKANLLPEADRAPVKLGGFSLSKLLLLTLFSLLFIWMGSGLIHKRVLLYQVNKQLAKITPEVKQVERLLEDSRDQVKKLQSFRRMEQTPDKLKILKDLTTLIPANTWLFNLRLSRQTLEMSGMSKSASDLIPLLEKSGWLTKTEFASPIVTDASKLEHFKIKAEVKSLEPAS